MVDMVGFVSPRASVGAAPFSVERAQAALCVEGCAWLCSNRALFLKTDRALELASWP